MISEERKYPEDSYPEMVAITHPDDRQKWFDIESYDPQFDCKYIRAQVVINVMKDLLSDLEQAFLAKYPPPFEAREKILGHYEEILMKWEKNE